MSENVMPKRGRPPKSDELHALQAARLLELAMMRRNRPSAFDGLPAVEASRASAAIDKRHRGRVAEYLADDLDELRTDAPHPAVLLALLLETREALSAWQALPAPVRHVREQVAPSEWFEAKRRPPDGEPKDGEPKDGKRPPHVRSPHVRQKAARFTAALAQLPDTVRAGPPAKLGARLDTAIDDTRKKLTAHKPRKVVKREPAAFKARPGAIQRAGQLAFELTQPVVAPDGVLHGGMKPRQAVRAAIAAVMGRVGRDARGSVREVARALIACREAAEVRAGTAFAEVVCLYPPAARCETLDVDGPFSYWPRADQDG